MFLAAVRNQTVAVANLAKVASIRTIQLIAIETSDV